jgi:hypothetical protein
MIAIGQHFKNIKISLDGGTFKDCKFETCVLIFSGVLPVTMTGNSFTDCAWEFAGAARNSVDFMRALYTGGGRDLIEGTINVIRGVAQASAPATSGTA